MVSEAKSVNWVTLKQKTGGKKSRMERFVFVDSIARLP